MEQLYDKRKILFWFCMTHVDISTEIWQKVGSNTQVTFMIELSRIQF